MYAAQIPSRYDKAAWTVDESAPYESTQEMTFLVKSAFLQKQV